MKIPPVKGNITLILDSDPEIMSGTLVFMETRVPLQTFFDYLECEAGLAKFLRSHFDFWV
ncbi:DUF433 domain-containing protein [Nostocaceae cyanobacterium CENA357]|uniref:DUF433 domain-containing protein n=1 Tax=Atlanticothrix silvestris CENA357 TaxID=1725252 RepID=A0A8J7HK81_9CYAN|nr:DUF433 domain-containing protein [Atlanticothrix silvestris]MBH8556393.1 DUF433 domain-containing protein [Atlanticothrix silvestris CENA357]